MQVARSGNRDRQAESASFRSNTLTSGTPGPEQGRQSRLGQDSDTLPGRARALLGPDESGIITELRVLLTPPYEVLQECRPPRAIAACQSGDIEGSTPCEIVESGPGQECSSYFDSVFREGDDPDAGEPRVGSEELLRFLAEQEDVRAHFGPEGTASLKLTVRLNDGDFSHVPVHGGRKAASVLVGFLHLCLGG